MDFTRQQQKIAIHAGYTVTLTQADVGSEIDCRSYKTLTIYINQDVNNSTTFRYYILGKHDTSTSSSEFVYDHDLVISPNTSISTADNYFQTPNADGLFVVKIPLDDSIPYIQLQVNVGALGVKAGIISVYASLGY